MNVKPIVPLTAAVLVAGPAILVVAFRTGVLTRNQVCALTDPALSMSLVGVATLLVSFVLDYRNGLEWLSTHALRMWILSGCVAVFGGMLLGEFVWEFMAG